MSAPTPQPPDYKARTRAKLRAVVTDAAGEPPLFTPLQMQEVGPNAVADLRVRWRCHPKLPEPDECETAILELLYRRHLTRTVAVIAELQEWFSPATIRRRLRRMVKLEVLRHSTRPPHGYDLDPRTRSMAEQALPDSA